MIAIATDAVATCAACGDERRLRDFLLVTDRRTGAAWYVCRPGLTRNGVRGETCFHRVVPAAERASIALADPDSR